MMAVWASAYLLDAVLMIGLWWGRNWIATIEPAPGDEGDLRFVSNAFLVLFWIVAFAAIAKIPFVIRLMRKPRTEVS